MKLNNTSFDKLQNKIDEMHQYIVKFMKNLTKTNYQILNNRILYYVKY